MSETLRKIDELLTVLDQHVSTLRAEAVAAGFRNMSIKMEWSCIPTEPLSVRVFLVTDTRGVHDSVDAPTAEDAFTECARRLNWQRDVNMKRIAATKD